MLRFAQHDIEAFCADCDTVSMEAGQLGRKQSGDDREATHLKAGQEAPYWGYRTSALGKPYASKTIFIRSDVLW